MDLLACLKQNQTHPSPTQPNETRGIIYMYKLNLKEKIPLHLPVVGEATTIIKLFSIIRIPILFN